MAVERTGLSHTHPGRNRLPNYSGCGVAVASSVLETIADGQHSEGAGKQVAAKEETEARTRRKPERTGRIKDSAKDGQNTDSGRCRFVC